jgi:two-component system KDP operon response regulator KdpE
VVESPGGRRGTIDAGTHKPDLAIVDLGLPDFDGIEVIRRIREWSSMPILVLSARIHEQSKIEALDAGANDYVTKPFGIGELFARVRAALRHSVRAGSSGPILRFEDASVDLEKRRATRGAQELRLTPIEFRLLACLARHLGMVVTQSSCSRGLGPSHQADTHYLRIYMKQLRDKLSAAVPPPPAHGDRGWETSRGRAVRLRSLRPMYACGQTDPLNLNKLRTPDPIELVLVTGKRLNRLPDDAAARKRRACRGLRLDEIVHETLCGRAERPLRPLSHQRLRLLIMEMPDGAPIEAAWSAMSNARRAARPGQQTSAPRARPGEGWHCE